jgi:hypothetical protein
LNPQTLSQALCEQGAVLHLAEHKIDVLVGHWEWLDDHRVFYFEAGMDNQFGGHLLLFASASAPHSLGVAFYNVRGELTAWLAPVREQVDRATGDARNYQEAFRAWTLRKASMLGFIEQVKREMLA